MGLRGVMNGSALTADEAIDISSEMRFPGVLRAHRKRLNRLIRQPCPRGRALIR